MPPRPRFPGKPERKDEHRINDFIRVPVVRLVDQNGAMVGEVPTEQARRMAREAGLDLVEVAPEARPPVCKILDYGKFKYAESKKKKARHHVAELKEVRMRPRTDDHDFHTKLRHARDFLEHGHKVLFTIFFRGREMAHKELGKSRMEQIKKDLDDIAKVEHDLSMQGPRMQITLMPKPGVKPKPVGDKPATKPEDGTSRPEGAPVPQPAATQPQATESKESTNAQAENQ
ncbi:MAG: translation initiation factor IF-3 [Planctomycetes bacterium]|nr:translation initiation factor IF-3 [Planctomycetota bacterium]